MKTPRIAWVEDEDATGDLAEHYAHWMQANPGRTAMPDVLKCMSARPELLKGMMDISYAVHFADGHLTHRVKEMMATYVSALNQCRY